MNKLSKKNLEDALRNIKQDYELAIRNGGNKQKESLIRSGKLINHIHEFIKKDLIVHGVSKNKIYPTISKSTPELRLSGFLKNKFQDITVLPDTPKQEEITSNSVLIGKQDIVGTDLTNKAITINVRSQLSSLAKNFDTLFERTYAESLNLHMRSHKIVLGEIYLIPLYEYLEQAAKQKKIEFSKNPINEKFPIGFNALNARKNIKNSAYKYERVVLLVVDFRQSVPKIINKKQLLDLNIIDEKISNTISDNLFNPHSLVPNLLEIYKIRHDNILKLKN